MPRPQIRKNEMKSVWISSCDNNSRLFAIPTFNLGPASVRRDVPALIVDFNPFGWTALCLLRSIVMNDISGDDNALRLF